MSLRDALVIGSNCEALGARSLDFVEDVAGRLFDVLIDPALGGCDPDASRLLIDPTLSELAVAVRTAVHESAKRGASLILSFLGHAVAVEPPYATPQLYLLPINGSPHPDTDSGYHFGQRLREVLGSEEARGLDGLLVLLDVCRGGIGLLDCIRDAATLAANSDMRMELLASVFDLPARGGCFTRTVADEASLGMAFLSSDYISAADCANLAAQRCSAQESPLRIAAARGRRVLADPGLWVARNLASRDTWPLADSHAGGLAVELTRQYVATKEIKRVVGTIANSPITWITGAPGQGKSSLLAALARPEVVRHLVPAGYLSAVAFGSLTPTSVDLAFALREQLLGLESYVAALHRFEETYEHKRELLILSPLQRWIFGPLSLVDLAETDTIRIAIDGFDSFPPVMQRELTVGIRLLFEGQLEEDSLRFILTARDSLVDQEPSQVVELLPPSPRHMKEVLTRRPEAAGLWASEAPIDSWLELSVLAESLEVIDVAHVAASASKGELYTALLEPLMDDETIIIVAVLASDGVGPVMPLSILTEASRRLGGPPSQASVADALTAIGRLVSRSKPGTPQEQVGLSHESLLAWARLDTRIASMLRNAHEAILDALNYFDACGSEDHESYRVRARPEHLWVLGQYDDAASAVVAGLGGVPVDNAAVLDRWVNIAASALSDDHPITLGLALESAKWLARTGNIVEASRRCAETAALLEATMGGTSREALAARLLEAELQGRQGYAGTAVSSAGRVVKLSLEVLGEDHPLTLDARSEEAKWLGKLGDWESARSAHERILERRTLLLGADAAETLRSRGYLAYAMGKLGHSKEAADEFSKVAEIQARTSGDSDRETMVSRVNEIRWLQKAGEAALAVTHSYRLIPLLLETFGSDDPLTLSAYSVLANSKTANGHFGEAVRVLDHLIPRYVDVLGRHATETLYARINRANLRAKVYSLERGQEDMIELVEEIARIRPPEDDVLLHARGNLAYLTARSGAVREATIMYRKHIADLEVFRGPDHKSTLHAKRLLDKVHNIRRPESAERDRRDRLHEGLIDQTLDSILPESPSEVNPKATFDEFALNQVRRAVVTRVVDFGAFVDVEGFRGLIHVSELSWDPRQSPQLIVQVGDELVVEVCRLDPDSRQVGFSLKRATIDPLVLLSANHPLGATVSGKVVRSTTRHTRQSELMIELPDGVVATLERAQTGAPYALDLDSVLTLILMDIDLVTRRVLVRLVQN